MTAPAGARPRWLRSAAVAKLLADLEDLDYSANRHGMLPANRIHILENGDRAFPDMLRAIDAATRTVHLETYIFEPDTIGTLFAQSLMQRARAGVAVRVIYDSVGGWNLPGGFLADLRDAGVELVEYRPLVARSAWGRWTRRDHRKILVIDGTVAFTGGLNLGDDYAPRDIGGGDWRDTHIRVEGPVVCQLEAMFSDIWLGEGGAGYPPYAHEAEESAVVDSSVFAEAIGSDDHGHRTAIRREYLHAIRRARSYVYLANAYFVPDRGIRRALVAAARRGVGVHVLTSKRSDVRSVQFAGEYTYERLLRGGVHIHLWPHANMHAKTAVIDGVWSVVGSYNLDYVSLFKNLEAVVVMTGRAAGADMRAMFERDLARAEEIGLPAWRRRGPWRRLAEWFFYRFRRWL